MKKLFLISSLLMLNQFAFAELKSEANLIHNPDGSISATNITVMRGDQIYPIAFDGGLPYETTCAMLGFEGSLKGTGLNTNEDYDGDAVLLKTQGTFQKTVNFGKKVSKVTCANKTTHKTIVQFDQSPNPDGSVKITNLKILRGDLTYLVAANYSTVFDSACRLAGFTGSLAGASLNSYFTDVTAKAHVRPDGTYDSMAYNSPYSINKVTCYKGEEPDMIILIGGNTYRREF